MPPLKPPLRAGQSNGPTLHQRFHGIHSMSVPWRVFGWARARVLANALAHNPTCFTIRLLRALVTPPPLPTPRTTSHVPSPQSAGVATGPVWCKSARAHAQAPCLRHCGNVRRQAKERPTNRGWQKISIGCRGFRHLLEHGRRRRAGGEGERERERRTSAHRVVGVQWRGLS